MSQTKRAPATGSADAPAGVQQSAGTESQAAAAQVASMTVEPQREHRWLQKLVGEWTYETHVPAQGDHPAELDGTERVRGLGEIWVLAEGTGEMQGVPATTLMTLGYDPATKRVLGTWIGSMMTHMWVYDGELDANGKVLTLNADGPSMGNDGTTSHYRDVIEFDGDDRRRLSASVQGADGSWQTFMTMTYRRTKPGV